jgi:hypothetical protein
VIDFFMMVVLESSKKTVPEIGGGREFFWRVSEERGIVGRGLTGCGKRPLKII